MDEISLCCSVAALLMAAKGSRKKAWREVLAEVKADEGKQQE